MTETVKSRLDRIERMARSLHEPSLQKPPIDMELVVDEIVRAEREAAAMMSPAMRDAHRQDLIKQSQSAPGDPGFDQIKSELAAIQLRAFAPS